MDSTHPTKGPWYFAEIQCQVQAVPWSTSGSTQIPTRWQGLASFVERAPHMTQLEASSTSKRALHHHQGCGWQLFWIKYSPFLGLHPIFNVDLLRPSLFPIALLRNTFLTISWATQIEIVWKSHTPKKLTYQFIALGFTKLLVFHLLGSCLGFLSFYGLC